MSNYSLHSLAAAIDFDIEDFIPLMILFLDTTDLNLSEISTAIEISDSVIISSNIHNIKGASMNLGLEAISKIMEEMSRLNKIGSYADIKRMISQCKNEIDELRKVLERS